MRMSWLKWAPWQTPIFKQFEADRIKRERDQHESIVSAINGITNEIHAVQHLQHTNEARKVSREWVSIVGLLITAAAAVIGIGLNVVQMKRSRDALLLDQRAWLGIKDIVVASDVTVGKALVIDIQYTNSGKTPGVDIKLTDCKTGESEDSMIKWDCGSANLAIAPNQVMAITNTSDPLSQAYFDRLKIRAVRTYFRGVIQYDDIFRITHHTGFCAFFTGVESIKFSTCSNGNYMD